MTTSPPTKKKSSAKGKPLELIFLLLFAVLTVVEIVQWPGQYFSFETAAEELPWFLGFFAYVNFGFYKLLGLAGMIIPPMMVWVMFLLVIGKWTRDGVRLSLQLLPVFLLAAISFAAIDKLFLDYKYYLGGAVGNLIIRWIPATIWVWPVFLVSSGLCAWLFTWFFLGKRRLDIAVWNLLNDLSIKLKRSRIPLKSEVHGRWKSKDRQTGKEREGHTGRPKPTVGQPGPGTGSFEPGAAGQAAGQPVHSPHDSIPRSQQKAPPAEYHEPHVQQNAAPAPATVPGSPVNAGQNETEKQYVPDPVPQPRVQKREEYKPAQASPVFSLDLRPGKPCEVMPDLSVLGELPTMLPDEEEDLETKAQEIEKYFREHRVQVQVDPGSTGPVINTFHISPRPGVSISAIEKKAEDVSLAMGYGKNGMRFSSNQQGQRHLVCEVPRDHPQEIYYQDTYVRWEEEEDEDIRFLLGVDIQGEPVSVALEPLPHLLVAGVTGSGKSVFLNSIIVHLLLHYSPELIRIVLIDMKSLEFSPYESAPHLAGNVITDVRDAESALDALIDEMEARYKILNRYQVRNLTEYREECIARGEKPELCRVAVIIDELADLLMTGGEPVQKALIRLAQKARAVGIHLIVATQRPSVDVVTGLLKANFPTKIAFKVSSAVNSRVILDESGAESLLGNGDFLILFSSREPERMHSGLVTTTEVRNLSRWWKENS